MVTGLGIVFKALVRNVGTALQGGLRFPAPFISLFVKSLTIIILINRYIPLYFEIV